jgi:hypothetical protein
MVIKWWTHRAWCTNVGTQALPHLHMGLDFPWIRFISLCGLFCNIKYHAWIQTSLLILFQLRKLFGVIGNGANEEEK